jgi:hypothetical protein
MHNRIRKLIAAVNSDLGSIGARKSAGRLGSEGGWSTVAMRSLGVAELFAGEPIRPEAAAGPRFAAKLPDFTALFVYSNFIQAAWTNFSASNGREAQCMSGKLLSIPAYA